MKKIIVLSFLCVLFSAYRAKASTSMYRVNDAAVEAAFDAAKPIVLTLAVTNSILNPLHNQKVLADKNAWVAIILNLFLGAIAIHRVYLGGTPVLILGYLITVFGIFGIVPLVDIVVLIINNADISKYVNNNRYFMWA